MRIQQPEDAAQYEDPLAAKHAQPRASTGRRRCRALLVLLLLLATACSAYYLVERFWVRNFHTVVPGQVYRSAQPTESMLRRIVTERGIRSVIKLNSVSENDLSAAEHGWADALGVKLIYIPIAVHHLPTRQQMAALLDALESAPRPVLVHCNAGADRTGMAAAVAAMQSGAELEQAIGHISVRYLHLPIFGEDVDELFDQYRADQRAAGRAVDGWDAFRTYIRSDYYPTIYHAELSAQPAVLRAGENGTAVAVKVTNLSARPWMNAPTNPIVLVAYQRSGEAAKPRKVLVRQRLPAMKPGESFTVHLRLDVPEGAGPIELDLLHEGIAYFADKGSAAAEVRIAR